MRCEVRFLILVLVKLKLDPKNLFAMEVNQGSEQRVTQLFVVFQPLFSRPLDEFAATNLTAFRSRGFSWAESLPDDSTK